MSDNEAKERFFAMATQDVQTQRRLEMDQEIATLRHNLYNLLSQRNSLLPISKLPVEIFSTIFWMHQQAELAEDDTSFNWMRVSHVCRQWRQISVNMPLLWSSINLKYPLWTQEMVKRSQKLGLIITVRSNEKLRQGSIHRWIRKLVNIQKFIATHLNRIREINIDVFPEELYDILTLLLQPLDGPYSKNAPQLQAIRLPEIATPLNSPRQKDPMLLLEQFFVHATNLKILDLTWTKNWDSRLFTNLTHLKVVNPPGFGRPKQVHFLSALARMPNLKYLDLRGEVLPLFGLSTQHQGCGPVSLPELRFLTVEDAASIVPDFLESINFHSPFVTDIRHNAPSSNFADVIATISRLPSTYSSSPSTVRGLRLDLSMTVQRGRPPDHHIQMEFETWDRVPSFSTLETFAVNPFRGNPFLTLGLSWVATIEPLIEAQQTTDALSQFCNTVPCNNLFVLSLTSSELKYELPEIQSTLFRKVLGIQPDLHTVFVSGSIFNTLIKSLEPFSEENDKDEGPSKPQILFPKMHHLSITNVNFRRGSSELFDCLFARMELGFKLETLTISNSSGLNNGTLIAQLDQVTNNLAWDQWRLPLPS